jgi:TatD DNase family protein
MNPPDFAALPLVDTHCHLDLLQDKAALSWENLQALIDPMPEALVQVACHPGEFQRTLAYLESPRIYASFGVHPHEPSLYTPEVESLLCQYLMHPKALACGETGLDYFYDLSPQEMQRRVFEQQIAVALKMGKPLVLHLRAADADALYILRNAPLHGHRLHVHCFTGSQSFAADLLNLDAEVYFGFTGILTFRTAADLRAVLPTLPTDRLLTETDSPYLAPVPHRGKPAHPGMVGLVLQTMAQELQRPLEEMAGICLDNARRFYDFPHMAP